jgi:hypothetical protein
MSIAWLLEDLFHLDGEREHASNDDKAQKVETAERETRVKAQHGLVK